MTRLVDWMSDGAELPTRAVCVTFDDGTRCLLDTALPVLSEFGIPATAYLVAGKLGADNDWLQRSGWSRRRLLGTSDLQALIGAGIEIGSHSMNHADLSVETPDVVERELRESRQRLEDVTGRGVVHFAYPFGRYTPQAYRATAQAGYRSAVTVKDGRVHRSDDPHLINRVEVYHWDGIDDFAAKMRWAAADPRPSLRLAKNTVRRTLQRIGVRRLQAL